MNRTENSKKLLLKNRKEAAAPAGAATGIRERNVKGPGSMRRTLIYCAGMSREAFRKKPEALSFWLRGQVKK